jgi:hypothetical protein
MFGPRHERWVEELNVALQYKESITSSGAVMTLPDATADLKDWLNDPRKFVPMQYDDWMQVIHDFRASVNQTGPKLTRRVEPVVKHIDPLLRGLFIRSSSHQVGSPVATFLNKFLPRSLVNQIVLKLDSLLLRRASPAPVSEKRDHKIDPAVRADILRHVEQLDTQLASDDAIVDAWRDLLSYTRNLKRTIEDVAFCRDTLHAIAQRRNLDVVGSFGLFNELRSLVSDVANAVHEEIQRESGGEFEPCDYPPGTPSGESMKRRLELCEQLLRREPERGDCIVWLKVAPASLPQLEVTHGQVTFYNGVHLSGLVGKAEHADRFKIPPIEVLTLSPEEGPILQDGEVLWEYNPNVVYARVVLLDIELHTADTKARALVEGLIAINHAMKDSW